MERLTRSDTQKTLTGNNPWEYQYKTSGQNSIPKCPLDYEPCFFTHSLYFKTPLYHSSLKITQRCPFICMHGILQNAYEVMPYVIYFVMLLSWVGLGFLRYRHVSNYLAYAKTLALPLELRTQLKAFDTCFIKRPFVCPIRLILIHGWRYTLTIIMNLYTTVY